MPWPSREAKRPPGPASTAHGRPPAPLGELAASCGSLEALRPRFERLAAEAWFTRKISVILPARSAEGRPEGDAAGARLAERLRLQRGCYELEAVPLAALGDQAFADAVAEFQICCLSRGRGLGTGSVVAVHPPGELIASLDAQSFERLGVEEPAKGADKLLRRKFEASGRRHVRISLGVSKTRRKQAADPRNVVSRWRALAPAEEVCNLTAYCGREPPAAFDFAPLRGPRTAVRRLEPPSALRRLRPAGAAWPPLGALAGGPQSWGDDAVFGLACEELLDWLGALLLGMPAQFDTEALAAELPAGAGLVEPGAEEEVWLWTMGDSLMGPLQVRHALRESLDTAAAGRRWCLFSLWGAEDAPISHHGGAHGFDLCGAHHAHLLAVWGEAGCRCLMLEASNALDSAAS